MPKAKAKTKEKARAKAKAKAKAKVKANAKATAHAQAKAYKSDTSREFIVSKLDMGREFWAWQIRMGLANRYGTRVLCFSNW